MHETGYQRDLTDHETAAVLQQVCNLGRLRLIGETDEIDPVQALAAWLTDRETGESTTAVIAHEAETAFSSPTVAVYALYAVAKKAAETNPNSKLPEGFLDFVLGLSETNGETDITFNLMAMNYDGAYTTRVENGTQPTKSIYELRDETAETLGILALETHEALEIAMLVKKTYLSAQIDSQHAADRATLLKYSQRPTGLHFAIKKGLFLTDAGREAAAVQHDKDLLFSFHNKFDLLFVELMNHRFKTDRGIEAATAQHDSQRLQACAGKPQMTYDLLGTGKFITLQGIQAAIIQNDSDRIDMHSGNPTQLQRDLNNKRFLSDAGREAAQDYITQVQS